MKNVIIAGFGFMGGMHAQVYARLRGAKLVAVVDMEPARTGATLKRLGLPVPVYTTLAEAVAAHHVDVVDVCAPTPAHPLLVREAIARGKHVFCEKPLALTAKEARRLAAEAKRAGIAMQVGQCIRFWPEYEAFTRFVRQQRAGRLLSLSLQRRAGEPGHSIGNWMNKGAQSGGAALELHIHDTDYVLHLLGMPEAVTSVGTRRHGGWDHIFTTYRFRNVVVTAEGGWNYPPKWGFQMAFQGVFEHGAVEFDSTRSPSLVMTSRRGERQPLRFKEHKSHVSTSGAGNISALGGYHLELAYFFRRLANGKKPKIATPEQAAESIRVVEAEIRSAATGRTIAL